MAETAAHLVEHVFPQVLVRQWVVTFPRRLRRFLHRDPVLLGRVRCSVLRAIESGLRRCCPDAPRDSRFGAVQRRIRTRLLRLAVRQGALTPLELLDRLAALVPPPRRHRHHYAGVLAPRAALRARVTACAGLHITDFTPVTVPAPDPALPFASHHRASIDWARHCSRNYNSMKSCSI